MASGHLIRTEDGWLVLYHAIDDLDPGRYKMGRYYLDLTIPKRNFIVRSDQSWSRTSDMKMKASNREYCIRVEPSSVDGTLFVYYGGADTVACVATADLKQFLEEVKKGGSPKLAKVAKLAPSVNHKNEITQFVCVSRQCRFLKY